MASTRKGVWELQQVRDKYLQSLWANPNTLFVWGEGGGGRLGVGNKVGGGGDQSYSSPIQLPGEWSVVSTGDVSSAGVKSDGSLWTWGYAEHGTLGHNQMNPDTPTVSPKQVGTNTNWSYVHANNDQMGGITSSGELFVWGTNNSGNLGLNDKTQYSSPVQVPGTTWKELSFGSGTTIFRKTDGTIWSCGANSDGQLGQNNETGYSSPKQIGTQTNWTLVSTGTKQSWGLTNPGALYGWGESVDGNLGFNQSNAKYSSPKQLPGSWKSVSGSKSTSWGVKTDGTLWGWGQGNVGQRGDNNRNQSSSPKQVGTDTTWELVEGPRSASVNDDPCVMGVKTDGTLWTWGQGSGGSLGLNNPPGTRSSPCQVGTSSKWTSNRDELGVGKYYMFAIEKGLTPSQL